MKHLIFGLIATVLFSNLTFGQEKVGKNMDGKFIITENLNLLKESWRKLTNEIVTNISIVSHETDGEVWYYLIGTTESGTKVATTLDYSNNTFFVPNQNLDSSSTATCSGCRWSGCDPRWLPGLKKWICDDPCLTCTKTVTATKPEPKKLTAWSE